MDLTPLRNLINLQILDLQGNKISDISPLSNLVHITRLNLSANKMNSLKSLSGMKLLTEFRAVKNQITDLSPLSTIKMRKYLCFSFQLQTTALLTSLRQNKFLNQTQYQTKYSEEDETKGS
ncbi:leucine-rich_repeat domain-containing protein [Hexamita inflata]|uniref:Leucine-rich repeat domain-containing protein n=1 Tax=Hexamita inflata TaxID=28002 RepID=A0AA86R1C9_9EUKA|nr:leucine-rich repeat domain-containing protein [Hexamita inflata]